MTDVSNRRVYINNQLAIPCKPKYKCKICNFSCELKKEYAFHVKLSHATVFICSQCGYKTKNKVNYKRHIRNVHENQRTYQCSKCDLTFKRSDTLKQHQVVHTNQNNCDKSKEIFKCKKCYKIVRSASYLKEHELSHSETKSILCEVCGVAFKTPSACRSHLNMVHHGKQKIRCQICDKIYISKFSLQRHLKSIHNDELNKKENSHLSQKISEGNAINLLEHEGPEETVNAATNIRLNNNVLYSQKAQEISKDGLNSKIINSNQKIISDLSDKDYSCIEYSALEHMSVSHEVVIENFSESNENQFEIDTGNVENCDSSNLCKSTAASELLCREQNSEDSRESFSKNQCHNTEPSKTILTANQDEKELSEAIIVSSQSLELETELNLVSDLYTAN